MISLIAAPVYLVAELVCLTLNKKVWDSALFWSGAVFVLILAVEIVATKIQATVRSGL